MKKPFYFAAILFSIIFNASSFMLPAQKTIKGNYRLTGVHDLASGFQFNDDGTFNFFYMYGVVDRFAKGTYEIVNDTIKLQSQKKPGKDFTVKSKSKRSGSYTVVVKDKNPFLIGYVTAMVFVGEQMHSFRSDKDGVISIELGKCDRILLYHELYPDIFSEIKTAKTNNNYFEVTLNESLQQVSFKGIDLFFDGNDLRCLSNYFLPFENIVFVKED